MSSKQIFLVIVVGITILTLVGESIRRQMLREKYSLLWVFIGASIITIPLLFDIYSVVATFIGIKSPISFYLFVSIVWLLLLSFQFSLAISTAYTQRKGLNQYIAILENRVSQLEAALKEGVFEESTKPENSD